MYLSSFRSNSLFDHKIFVMEKVNTVTVYGGYLQTRFRKNFRIYTACLAILLLYITTYSFPSFTSGTNLKHLQFPRKIWQTWKVDPLNFEERDLNWARSWTQKNPNYRYEVLTDQNDIQYVEHHFGPNGLNRPDIIKIYKTVTAKIVKADLLRYMIMYVDGGIYTDIDVEALRPLDHFIPERFSERDVDMVIGVEIDQPEYNNHTILGKKSQSFCQWTFMCKPGLPVMLRLIENIMSWLNSVARKQGKSVAELQLNFDEIITGTGPSAFTEAILDEMAVQTGGPVGWHNFHNLRESKSIGRVLVLTVEAFAAGQGHSDSGTHSGKIPLVRHHYHASGWPSQHPRFNHPMYGEVENCNWEAECVRKWDEDVKQWETLSPDEKAKQLAIKEAKEAAEAEAAAAEEQRLQQEQEQQQQQEQQQVANS